MQTKDFLIDVFFRHDLMDVIYKKNISQYDEYEPEARHIAHQLSLGIPFKTAIHDVFSFFFRSGELTPKAEIVSRIEVEYYIYISKYEIK